MLAKGSTAIEREGGETATPVCCERCQATAPPARNASDAAAAPTIKGLDQRLLRGAGVKPVGGVAPLGVTAASRSASISPADCGRSAACFSRARMVSDDIAG